MDTISPVSIRLQPTARFPNNPVLPVLVYRGIFDAQTADKHKRFQRCFEHNGWRGIWKNGLYDYHHFHPTSHEVLGIARGAAEIELGGEDGKVISLTEGDLLILPAGTAHKSQSASIGLVVIGAYPEGQQNYCICRHRDDLEGDICGTVATVPLPESDPVYGENGPLVKLWAARS